MIGFLKKIYFEIKYTINRLKPVKPIILMYHRIAIDPTDKNMLCVSPENFRAHIRYLKRYKNIVKLEDIIKPNIPTNSTALTFDDGYSDNLHNALPILEEYDAPATIFVTVGLLGQRYPWDSENSSGIAITESELKILGNHRLIEIGAHTITHPRLSTLSVDEQSQEIKNSKEVLEKIINKKIVSFAYPFGDFNGNSMQLVEKLEFKRAVIVKAKPLTKNQNHYTLPRFIVRDWDIKKFTRKVNIFR